MQSRTTYTLVTTLLLTAIACAKQVDGELESDNPDEINMQTGGSSKGGSSSKAGSGSVIITAGTSNAGKGGTGTALPPAGSTGGKGGKGAGGSAGKAGGTSEEGGAADPGEPVNMPVDGLSVTFKAGDGGDEVDFLGGELFVQNDSAESFSLSTLKIRYYFTNELNSAPAFVWQWGQFGPTSNLGGITCTGEVVEMPSPEAGANYYVELTCPDGSFDSGSLLKTSWKAGNQGNGKLTQSDDWSFTGVDNIVVMDGNTIIWGVAP